MKKTLIAALSALCLFFLLNSCSGHFLRPAAPQARALSAAEALFVCTEWSRDGQGADVLCLYDDMTGLFRAQAFQWHADGGALSLEFFPGCCVGARVSAALSLGDNGEACLTLAQGAYLPSILHPRPVDDTDAAPEVSEEELLGRDLSELAISFLGWKYKYGGKAPETGFDCSGFTYFLFSQYGYTIARVANDQAKQGVEVPADALLPGDLLAFHTSGDYVGHVGLYVGNGYYIHAMGEAYGVVLTALDDPDLPRKFTARRIIGCEELLTVNVNAAA